MSFSPRSLTGNFSISPQLDAAEVSEAAARGFRSIICARPDDEQPGQPSARDIEQAAIAAGLDFVSIPVVSGVIPDSISVAAMRKALDSLPGPVLGYCRSGTRAAWLWAMAEHGRQTVSEILSAGTAASIDLSPLKKALESSGQETKPADKSSATRKFDIVIAGGGAAGISVAASILKRRSGVSIAIIEPSSEHYYQPGWTLVGGGVFRQEQTRRPEAPLIPKGVTWIRTAVTGFQPEAHEVGLGDGTTVAYRVLIVATGIELNWGGIPGLEETLGKNGVTSNYRYDLAPYTWKLVQELRKGNAVFTQPPMPIKCAGGPQKAVYLSCDHWLKEGVLRDINVSFDTATPALFGVADYVPALMNYIRRYNVDLKLKSKLVSVDGAQRIATFERVTDEGTVQVQREFDMLHVVPPQVAPKVVRESALAGADGFVAVDPATLRHVTWSDVFALGDVAGTSNAKTVAAVRKQVPVVAINVLEVLDGKGAIATYDGYGACPLTVERGKIVLAEFSYGGKLCPTLPVWLLNGTQPTSLAWFMKKEIMPRLYWDGMFKGHEILVAPKVTRKS